MHEPKEKILYIIEIGFLFKKRIPDYLDRHYGNIHFNLF